MPPLPPYQQFGALVAARVLYDLWAAERNVHFSAIESINRDLKVRSETTFTRRECEPRWWELTTEQKQPWLDKGHQAVKFILETEQ